MRVLLPPSETKRDGGALDARLDLSQLSFPALTRQRRTAIRAVKELSGDLAAMATALRLGPAQKRELEWNRILANSATTPAIERFTGVLFDGIDVPSLGPLERAFAAEHVVISSALFGLLGAADPVPAYRLSPDSRLPGVRLRPLWSGAVSEQLAASRGLVLDLRSAAYVALGPKPTGADPRCFAAVQVVAEGRDGTKRALNHFNKKGKGEFVRQIIRAGIDHPDVPSLLEWTTRSGIRLESIAAGRLQLTVDEVVGGV